MGFISKDVYERHKEKYSKALVVKKLKVLNMSQENTMMAAKSLENVNNKNSTGLV